MRRSRLALALAAALAVSSCGGCFGKFALTRDLYEKNKSVTGKTARAGIFFVLIIVPIYECALLGDLLIFNPIEFFSGDNVLDEPTPAP